jgi:hypothetical protein
MSEDAMERFAIDTLTDLRVTTLRSTRLLVGTLSGGQRQAIAIARAVLRTASLIVLDEPTAALGVAQAAQVKRLISELREREVACSDLAQPRRRVRNGGSHLRPEARPKQETSPSGTRRRTRSSERSRLDLRRNERGSADAGRIPPTNCRGTKRRRSRGCAASGSMLPIVIGLVIVWTCSRSRTVTSLSSKPHQPARPDQRDGIITTGRVLVLLIGEIDLSVGSVAGLASAVLALLLVHGVPWWLSVLAMIAAGACAGLIQGAWIVAFGVPSFIVTLAGLLGFYGLQLYLIQTQRSDAILVDERYIDDLTTTYLPGRYAWPIAVLLVVVVGITRGAGSEAIAEPG